MKHRVPAVLAGVQGLAIVAMWIAFIRSGVFRNGVRTVENNMLLALHVAAELIMGSLLVIGSVGMLLGRQWARLVAIAGFGAVIYSTVNSMSDTLRNKPTLTPLLVLNLLIASAMIIMLALGAERRLNPRS